MLVYLPRHHDIRIKLYESYLYQGIAQLRLAGTHPCSFSIKTIKLIDADVRTWGFAITCYVRDEEYGRYQADYIGTNTQRCEARIS